MQSREFGLNLSSNATKNTGETSRVGVDASRVDLGQKLIDITDVEDDKNFGQRVLQVENENATKNWILIVLKKSTSSWTFSSTSSPGSGKGAIGNFMDNEKRQDISNASRDLLYSNRFDALLKATEKDGNIMAPTLYTSNPEVAEIIQENQNVMLFKSNSPIKSLMVTLNTLAHEVTSPIFGVTCESGKLLMATEDDNELVKEE